MPAADDRTDEDVPRQLTLDLPTYSGPMDLLLDLIRDQEIDIFDIPIARITRQYLDYVERMKALDLEVGGEWLEMAATLVYIKSKTLLPDPEEEEEEGPDPREELVRRLVEHQMFQWAADQLEDRPQMGRDFLPAAPKARDLRQEVGPPEVREADLGDLVDALHRLIDDRGEEAEWIYEVTREKLSLQGVILDIADRLDEEPQISFRELFEGIEFTRHVVVTTFVALLEMARLDMIRLFQPKLDDGQRPELILERSVIDIVEVSQTLDFANYDA